MPNLSDSEIRRQSFFSADLDFVSIKIPTKLAAVILIVVFAPQFLLAGNIWDGSEATNTIIAVVLGGLGLGGDRIRDAVKGLRS